MYSEERFYILTSSIIFFFKKKWIFYYNETIPKNGIYRILTPVCSISMTLNESTQITWYTERIVNAVYCYALGKKKMHILHCNIWFLMLCDNFKALLLFIRKLVFLSLSRG
jgi:hypothetical protein